jgi:hypothetical protein
VALANGRFDEAERALLAAAARAYRVDVDLDAVAPIEAAELAAAVTDREARTHVLQACMLMSLSDQEVTADELAVLGAFARALEVDEKRMKVMHDLAKGRLRLSRYHLVRSSAQGIRAQVNDPKLADLLRVAGVLPPNHELAERCRALASLPDGTLGREYVRHREQNGFPWPGEKGGIVEGAMHHDLTHVLTGFDTDPLGEIQVGAFTAGMKKIDPFLFLLFPMLEFHLGLAVRPFTKAYPGHYDAALAFRAHQAGARCRRDLSDHWDFWPVMDRTVTSLRDEYGIDT